MYEDILKELENRCPSGVMLCFGFAAFTLLASTGFYLFFLRSGLLWELTGRDWGTFLFGGAMILGGMIGIGMNVEKVHLRDTLQRLLQHLQQGSAQANPGSNAQR